MSEVTPRDREEKLLAAIADGTAEELPTPRNRKEKLLKEFDEAKKQLRGNKNDI